MIHLDNTAYLDREIRQHCSHFVDQVRTLAPVDRVAVVLYDRGLSSSRIAFEWRAEEGSLLNPKAFSTPAESPEKKVLNLPLYGGEGRIGAVLLHSQAGMSLGRQETQMVYRVSEDLAMRLENAELSQRLQTREQELAALEEIAKIITSAPAIDLVYERFALELQGLVEFGWMNINFIDVKGNRLVNQYLFGEGRPDRYSGAVRPLKGTFAEKVLASGQTVISQLSADSDSPVERELVEYGVKTSITLPLVSKGQIIAVLGVRSYLADAYGPREQEILERLANQIAPAVAAAQLAEQQQAQQAGVSTGEGGSGQSGSRHADLAHTLRSPLTSIKGYTTSLLRTDVSWPEELEREFLETIDREADRLNQAVSDLMDTSLDRDLPG